MTALRLKAHGRYSLQDILQIVQFSCKTFYQAQCRYRQVGTVAKVQVIGTSALKSGPVPVLGSSGLGPWTGPVLIFPNMEGPHKTSFMRSWAVLGPVLVKTGL